MRKLSDLARELRRRHVFRVAAGYAFVGWIVIEAASVLVPQLMLPEWLARAITVLVLLGFPIALVLAWAYDITPDGIRTTNGAGSGESPEDSRGDSPDAPERRPVPTGTASGVRRQALFAGATLALVAAGAAGWVILGGADRADLPEGAALLARVDELASDGRFGEAFALAEAAREEGEELPPGVRVRISDRLTVLTEPAGARLRALPFSPDGTEADGSPEWLDLGVSPLHGRTLPRGDYLLRVEREGYAAVERLASTSSARAGVPPAEVPETLLRIRLLPEDSVPDGMVFVPGGPYAVASRNLQGLLASLDDYFLDRFEVTNARFAEFVAAGGYLDREHWAGLFDDDGIADPEAELGSFTDRTGLPGPREWSGQRFRRGEGDHPVTGVSWYEAAAYCGFRDTRLPTLFEWEKAARDGTITRYESVFMPWGFLERTPTGRARANFSGEGTAPVDAHPFGISPYGAYDMAGNAKEWLQNSTEGGRAVTGGSWEDPVYLFAEVGSQDPLSSSPSVGFRCARRTGRPGARASGQGDDPLHVAVETPEYEPVGDAAFAGFLSHYAYDRRPVQGEVVERSESPGWVRERILFDGPGDDRAIGYLYLPTVGQPPHQVLAFVPGSDTFFGVRVPDATEWLLAPVIRSGRAVFAVVMEGMTERPPPPEFEPPAPSTARFRDRMVRHATELRMGLDYLETRDDVDMDALAYVGLSWGAGSRLGFAAVDDRFRAVIFVGGGIDERVQPTLPEASNVNFAPRIEAPTLLLNGRADEEHPWLTRALPLWNLLSEPKELVLVEGAGHVPPPEARVPAMLDFLDRHLGPARR